MSRKNKEQTPHPQTCERCPHRFSPNGCPSWIGADVGLIEENDAGEVRVVTGCYFQVMPRLMIHVIRAANRPAAAMNSLRNEIVGRQNAILGGVGRLMQKAGEPPLEMIAPPPAEAVLLLEAPKDGSD